MKQKEIASLHKVLEYKNQKVIDKTILYFNITTEEANEIFQELLKWLWLCAKAKYERNQNKIEVPPVLNVQAGIIIIDEIWHIFLLHTRDYEEFCHKYLGTFVHHSPAGIERFPPSRLETKNQLSYIYDNLGKETLSKWYLNYPIQYSLKNIKNLRKDPLEYLLKKEEL